MVVPMADTVRCRPTSDRACLISLFVSGGRSASQSTCMIVSSRGPSTILSPALSVCRRNTTSVLPSFSTTFLLIRARQWRRTHYLPIPLLSHKRSQVLPATLGRVQQVPLPASHSCSLLGSAHARPPCSSQAGHGTQCFGRGSTL